MLTQIQIRRLFLCPPRAPSEMVSHPGSAHKLGTGLRGRLLPGKGVLDAFTSVEEWTA